MGPAGGGSLERRFVDRFRSPATGATVAGKASRQPVGGGSAENLGGNDIRRNRRRARRIAEHGGQPVPIRPGKAVAISRAAVGRSTLCVRTACCFAKKSWCRTWRRCRC